MQHGGYCSHPSSTASSTSAFLVLFDTSAISAFDTWHYSQIPHDTRTGAFLVGIAGDFPICVVPLLEQDMEIKDIPFWGYFCQISDSTTSYGSYSGAVPNEKITWGKLDADTPKFIIESDATIVVPLIFAWILGW